MRGNCQLFFGKLKIRQYCNIFGFSLRLEPVNININYVEEIIALGRRVRSSVVDGLFYPEDVAGVLAYMRKIGLKRGKGGQARAIIAPHGAWEFSGSLVGAAFSLAGGRTGRDYPSRVVIMGPIHDKRAEGLFLSNSDSFRTPLGDLPVDLETVEALESCSPFFQIDDIPHLQEHSIEVLLPFVKYCFPEASIVPILMGKPHKPLVSTLSQSLRNVLTHEMENTLLVVSFNMVVNQGEEEALDMAWECQNLLEEGKCAELCKILQNGRITSCGGGLVTALLQSGLVDTMNPRLASSSLQSALGENGRTVYYGAFSFNSY